MNVKTTLWEAPFAMLLVVCVAFPALAQDDGTDTAAGDGKTGGESGAVDESGEAGDDESGATNTTEAGAQDSASADGGTPTEGASADEAADGGEDGESLGFQRSGRMEFDERLVKGQAAKSGAVYLFKRTPRRLPGLVPYRRSYRMRIVEPVLGKRELKAPVYTTDEKETESEEAPKEVEKTPVEDKAAAVIAESKKSEKESDDEEAEGGNGNDNDNGKNGKKKAAKKKFKAKPRKKAGVKK
ncbi:MAG: hypothetical protein JXR76_23160 [Deltaproteobacteria bacterium]|nr:hypothetical protein [Deltaproteobacteria bacterium]